MAAIALAVLGAIAGHAPVHADGGSSARNQTATTAPDDSGATAQAHAQRILRILSGRHANNWVRYWQARAECQAAPAAHDAAPLDRVLLTLTAALCAHIDARLGVNPADYPPRGEERSVGLLLNEPAAAAGYTLFTGYENSDVFLIDPLGRVAHAWHLKTLSRHAKLLDNGNLLAELTDAGIFEFDPSGNIIWQYNISRAHHDFIKMPNGNALLLIRRSKSHDEVIAAGANPEFVHEKGRRYDRIIEVRPTSPNGGEVVWEWSPWDHLVQDFDPAKPNYGSIAEHPELIDINFPLESLGKNSQNPLRGWLHANAIDYNPELDQIMLSPRHFSELWIIDHSATAEQARGHGGGNSGMGGDLLYRWGNPRAYGHGDRADQRLFWQHQTHWIPPGLPGAGNILIFNNGNEFSGVERLYSSVDEIALPADGYRYRRADAAAYPPAEPAWTYAAQTPADFYAPVLSGAQRLPNGNTLIVNGPAGAIFQATPDGRIVWKYVAPLNNRVHLRQGEPVTQGGNRVYRAYWYPPDYPGLRALDLTPGAYIEDLPDIYDKAYAALAADDFGDRLVDSNFDIYIAGESEDNRRLIYIKRPCAADDAQPEFFLHIIPARARDLPAAGQERDFDNRDFLFGDMGKASDDLCVAITELPRYPIERIRTGQIADAGALWRADIDLRE